MPDRESFHRLDQLNWVNIYLKIVEKVHVRNRIKDLSDSQRIYLVLGCVTSVILSLLIVFFDLPPIDTVYNFPSPPYSVSGIFNGIGAVASVLVSILLLYVYDKQREILSEQKELTEYQQTSLLRVEDHTLIDYQELKDYQDENHSSAGSSDNLVLYQTEYLELDISNVGLAPAHDLRVELYIKTDDERYTASLPMLAGSWKDVISDIYSNNQVSLLLNREGNAIATDTEAETHTVPLTVFTDSIPEDWKESSSLHNSPPANSVIRCAEGAGTGKTTVALLLWFRDGRGPQGPLYIRIVDVQSDEFLFAREAVEMEGKEHSDGADLKEILDTGESSPGDRIPDIEHPDVR